MGALISYFTHTDGSESRGTQLLLHSALLPQPMSEVTASSSTSSHSQAESSATGTGPASSLESSFTVVGHDLSTFASSSSSAPLPACSTVSLPSSARVALCHRVSQLAHCAAQGKVGSGFDVSAAYFGSQVYHRFSPRAIQHLLPTQPLSHPLSIDRAALVQCVLPAIEHDWHQPSSGSENGGVELFSPAAAASSFPPLAPLSAPSSPSSGRSPASTSPSSSYSSLSELERTPSPITPPDCSLCSALRATWRWDERVSRLQLPSFLQLLLADVQGGAKTPGMVQQLLRWREHSRDSSSRLYESMSGHMSAVELALTTLAMEEKSASRDDAAAQSLGGHRGAAQHHQAGRSWHALLSGDAPRCAAASSARPPLHEWLVRTLLQLRSSFAAIRSLYRAIGSAKRSQP